MRGIIWVMFLSVDKCKRYKEEDVDGMVLLDLKEWLYLMLLKC